jgi:hypothetical protein
MVRPVCRIERPSPQQLGVSSSRIGRPSTASSALQHSTTRKIWLCVTSGGFLRFGFNAKGQRAQRQQRGWDTPAGILPASDPQLAVPVQSLDSANSNGLQRSSTATPLRPLPLCVGESGKGPTRNDAEPKIWRSGVAGAEAAASPGERQLAAATGSDQRARRAAISCWSWRWRASRGGVTRRRSPRIRQSRRATPKPSSTVCSTAL